MKIDSLRIVLSTATAAALAGGCAVQGGATTDSATPAPNPTQVAATAPPSHLLSVLCKHGRSCRRPARSRPNMIQITQSVWPRPAGWSIFAQVLDTAKARALLANPANTPCSSSATPPLMPPHMLCMEPNSVRARSSTSCIQPAQRGHARRRVTVLWASALGPIMCSDRDA